MKNLELKFSCKDRSSALNSIKELGAEFNGILKQRDVYFGIKTGRLKLRTLNKNEHQLIFYKRANREGAKFSNYFISEITHPARVEKILKEIYGIKVIVNKTRKLYLWQNVRIHVDTVSRLGKFIEIEIVCKTLKDENGSIAKMKLLKKVFNITINSIIKFSYSDLLIGNGRS